MAVEVSMASTAELSELIVFLQDVKILSVRSDFSRHWLSLIQFHALVFDLNSSSISEVCITSLSAKMS